MLGIELLAWLHINVRALGEDSLQTCSILPTYVSRRPAPAFVFFNCFNNSGRLGRIILLQRLAGSVCGTWASETGWLVGPPANFDWNKSLMQ